MLHQYTAYGHLDGLSNATTGNVYWSGLGNNQWKHPIKEQFPGIITGNDVDYDSTGQSKTMTWTGSTADTVSYQYDSFGNLVARTQNARHTHPELGIAEVVGDDIHKQTQKIL